MKAQEIRFLKHLYDGLPVGEEAINAHVKALAYIQEAPEHQSELFDHLYGCLSILDSKASALLTFDSVVIAVFAIFLTQDLAGIEFALANIGLLCIAVSAYLLLSVVWVHWSTTDHLDNYDEHAQTLLTVRLRRTVKYRLAWDFAVLALLSLVTLVVLKMVYTVL